MVHARLRLSFFFTGHDHLPKFNGLEIIFSTAKHLFVLVTACGSLSWKSPTSLESRTVAGTSSELLLATFVHAFPSSRGIFFFLNLLTRAQSSLFLHTLPINLLTVRQPAAPALSNPHE